MDLWDRYIYCGTHICDNLNKPLGLCRRVRQRCPYLIHDYTHSARSALMLQTELIILDWWSFIQRCSPFSWADSLRSHVVLHEWLVFYSVFLNIHRSGVLTALAWLVPPETAAVSAQVLCTPYNHAPCDFMQSHIRKVYACLAVTCHLHFWQNDRDLLRATAVTRGWNGYRNKSHHRKSTLEKKILPPLLQGFEPATFQSRVRRSNHWAIPAPWHGMVQACRLLDLCLVNGPQIQVHSAQNRGFLNASSSLPHACL